MNDIFEFIKDLSRRISNLERYSGSYGMINFTSKSTIPTVKKIGDVYLDDGTHTGDGQPHLMYWNGATWKQL
jgi:hypothetical protein